MKTPELRYPKKLTVFDRLKDPSKQSVATESSNDFGLGKRSTAILRRRINLNMAANKSQNKIDLAKKKFGDTTPLTTKSRNEYDLANANKKIE